MKPAELAVRLGIALAAGSVVGLVDLWIFEPTWRGFSAGLAGGVAYYLILMLAYVPGARLPRPLLAGFAIVAGALAGSSWWLVCRCSAWWAAALVGALLALAHFASGGLFFRSR